MDSPSLQINFIKNGEPYEKGVTITLYNPRNRLRFVGTTGEEPSSAINMDVDAGAYLISSVVFHEGSSESYVFKKTIDSEDEVINIQIQNGENIYYMIFTDE